MSEAKDKFYEILVPKIVAHGYEYKKSKTSFVKIENGLEYQINFWWDGRGGTTMLDEVNVSINDVEVQKAIKKRTKRNGLTHIYTGWGYRSFPQTKIPVMYSRATLDLANNMNFRALSKMDQDEKYPPERILASANFVEDLIFSQVFPFFEKFKSTIDIYNYWRERVTENPETINFTENVKEMFDEFSIVLNLSEIPIVVE